MRLTSAFLLLVVSVSLVLGTRWASESRRRGTMFASLVIGCAIGNIVVLISAWGRYLTELISLITALILIVALQAWAFFLRERRGDRSSRSIGKDRENNGG